MSIQKNTASVAERMKNIQISKSTRDYLFMLGQLEDIHAKFLEVMTRDWGADYAERETMKCDGFAGHVASLKLDIANAMRDVMLNNICDNETEL